MKFALDKSENSIFSSIFLSYCQETSIGALKSMTRLEGDAIRLIRPEIGSAKREWMAVTIAQSSSFRLILRVNYGDDDAANLANSVRGEPELNIRQINDFVRETSNQYIGAIKQRLEARCGYAHTSYPLVTHAQDFKFFAPNPGIPHFHDQWLVGTERASILVAVSLEFFDRSVVRKIDLPAFIDWSAAGEVEFFAAM